MRIFESGDYKMISKIIEKRLPELRKEKNFNRKYIELIDMMEELEKSLSKEQQEKFRDIIKLFYETEEYYFAFSYCLGIKYGEDLKEL